MTQISGETNAPATKRFPRIRWFLRGSIAAILTLAALGSLFSITSDPANAILAAAVYGVGAMLALRRTRGTILSPIDRDVGTAALSVMLIGVLILGSVFAPVGAGNAGNAAPVGQSGSASAGGSGGSGAASTPTATPATTSASSGVQIRISYLGDWSGSISAGGSSKSVQGYGTESWTVSGSPNVVSVSAQKRDADMGRLTVEIIKDGEVVQSATTTAEYGVATASETFGY